MNFQIIIASSARVPIPALGKAKRIAVGSWFFAGGGGKWGRLGKGRESDRTAQDRCRCAPPSRRYRTTHDIIRHYTGEQNELEPSQTDSSTYGRVSPARTSPGPWMQVTADDDIATQHGVRANVVVDLVGDDGGGHRELDGRGVHHADDVARAGGAEGAEEGAVEAVLGVKLDDLLVVVGSLEQLDAGVERAAVGLEEDLHGVDRRLEGVGAEGAALDGAGGVEALLRRPVDAQVVHLGGERELELTNVAERDGVGAAGGLDHAAEGAHLAVLDVHAHLDRRVVRAVPELNVSVQGAALGEERDLHLVDGGVAVRPGAQRAALHQDLRLLGLLGPRLLSNALLAAGRNDAALIVGGALVVGGVGGGAGADRGGRVAQLHHRRWHPQRRRARRREEQRRGDDEAGEEHGKTTRGRRLKMVSAKYSGSFSRSRCHGFPNPAGTGLSKKKPFRGGAAGLEACLCCLAPIYNLYHTCHTHTLNCSTRSHTDCRLCPSGGRRRRWRNGITRTRCGACGGAARCARASEELRAEGDGERRAERSTKILQAGRVEDGLHHRWHRADDAPAAPRHDLFDKFGALVTWPTATLASRAAACAAAQGRRRRRQGQEAWARRYLLAARMGVGCRRTLRDRQPDRQDGGGGGWWRRCAGAPGRTCVPAGTVP
eukprot:scaffold27688_cov108-Isochrysis_galbana.AAC.1